MYLLETLFILYFVIISYVNLKATGNLTNEKTSYYRKGLRFVIPGSTQKIKEIFIGRCDDFQIVIHKDVYKSHPMNCKELWKQFSSAFAHKDRHTLKPSTKDYDTFFENVPKTFETENILLWSGVHGIVFKLANHGQRYTTIDQYMPGYALDNLYWCGTTTTTDGIDYKDCKVKHNSTSSDAFWERVSHEFASQAEGHVKILLNGSRMDNDKNCVKAFNPQRVLGAVEIKSLDSKKVRSVTVMIAHSLTGKSCESCSHSEFGKESSIQELETYIRKRGFNYTCVDDPVNVQHLLCIDHPEVPSCKHGPYSSSSNIAQSFSVILISLFLYQIMP